MPTSKKDLPQQVKQKINLGKKVARGKVIPHIQHHKDQLVKEPKNWGLWAKLAELYAKEQAWQDAGQCYDKVLENARIAPSMQTRIGLVYARCFRMKEAFELIGKSIEEEPNEPDHHLAICRLHRYMGQPEKALEVYARVKKSIAPEELSEYDITAESTCNLTAKNYVAGLSTLKMLWDKGTNSTALGFHKRAYKLPMWDGADLSGRSIYVKCEQGIGDAIVFLRYLPLLAKMGTTRIYVSAAKPLHRLLEGHPNIYELLNNKCEAPDADVEVAIFDLPIFFNTTGETVPEPTQFKIPKESIERADKILKPYRDKFNVGVLWTGNPRLSTNNIRSFPVQHFLKLADIPDLQMYSLYKGEMPRVLSHSPASSQILDVSNSDKDLADSAAFIEQLDLVITVDTAMAHLAGSLTTDAWCLLSFMPFWYFADGKSTPWYPETRLFTQNRPGAWIPVFQRVRTELVALIAAQKNQ